MKKQIIVDCDGVLLNWAESFLQYVNYYYPEFVLSTSYPQSYCVGSWFFQSSDFGYKLIQDFNHSSQFATLAPVAGAVKAIETLRDYNYEFKMVTAIGDDPEVMKNRQHNLITEFGHIDDFEIVGTALNISKRQALQDLNLEGTYYVEDNVDHAVSGLHVGLKPILINTPQNTHITIGDSVSNPDLSYGKIPRVSMWSELVENVIAGDFPAS